jgi:hypothetical protein
MDEKTRFFNQKMNSAPPRKRENLFFFEKRKKKYKFHEKEIYHQKEAGVFLFLVYYIYKIKRNVCIGHTDIYIITPAAGYIIA